MLNRVFVQDGNYFRKEFNNFSAPLNLSDFSLSHNMFLPRYTQLTKSFVHVDFSFLLLIGYRVVKLKRWIIDWRHISNACSFEEYTNPRNNHSSSKLNLSRPNFHILYKRITTATSYL